DNKTNTPPSPYEPARATLTDSCVVRKMIRLENYQDLLIDEQTWQAIDDPKTAEYFARKLFVIKEAIDSGPDGAREASEAILVNIEAAYLHTEAHRAAVRLYLLSLTGRLEPRDEPLQLINEAIKRGASQVERAGKGSAKGKRRR
ncbi:MAG: hypothetical protein ABW250_14950, partial [Pyrinomonadaceae bacterium]